MTDRHTLIAFLGVIVAIVLLAVIAAWKGTQTDLAIMTGLIGVLGTFRPRNAPAVEPQSTQEEGR